MSKYRKKLSREEIDAILFADTDESDLDSEDDGWDESFPIENEEIDASILEETENVEDEDLLLENACDENITWSETVNNDKINFSAFSCNSGPVHNLSVGSSPLDFLKLFFTDQVMSCICTNTNKYADFCAEKRGSEDKEWSPLQSNDELWAFFAVLLIMSINHLPRISDYWSNNPILGNNMIKKIMSRNRFLKLKHYFHLSDRKLEIKKMRKISHIHKNWNLL